MKKMVDIKNVVVIGVGQMGAGAAQVSLMAGFNVTRRNRVSEQQYR